MLTSALIITGCQSEIFKEDEPISLTKAEQVVSTPEFYSFNAEMLKLGLNFKQKFAELPDAEKTQVLELLQECAASKDYDQMKGILSTIEKMVDYDIVRQSNRIMKKAPGIVKLAEGIPQNEILAAVTKMDYSQKLVPTTKTNSEIAEYEAELNRLMGNCEGTRSSASGWCNWCVVECGSEAILAMLACSALTGPAAPVCAVAVMPIIFHALPNANYLNFS